MEFRGYFREYDLCTILEMNSLVSKPGPPAETERPAKPEGPPKPPKQGQTGRAKDSDGKGEKKPGRKAEVTEWRVRRVGKLGKGWIEAEHAATAAFRDGDLVAFVHAVCALYRINCDELVECLLPTLYQQYIGLSNMTLAFELYRLAHAAAENDIVEVAIASAVARMVVSRARQGLRAPAQCFTIPPPEPHPSSTPAPATKTATVPTSTATAVGAAGSVGGAGEGARVELREMGARAMPVDWLGEGASHLRDAVWHGLFSCGATLRNASTRMETILQTAAWFEQLRPHMSPAVFLKRFDDLTAVGATEKAFQEPIDADGHYMQTIRLYARVMRAWLIEDVGDRCLSIFLNFVLARLLSGHRTIEHLNSRLVEQLTAVDAALDDTHILAANILHLLNHPKSAKSDVKTNTKLAEWGLPRAFNQQRSVDWTSEEAAAWIREVEERAEAGGAAARSHRSSRNVRNRANPELDEHLKGLEKQAREHLDVHISAARGSPGQISGAALKGADLGRLLWSAARHWAHVDNRGLLAPAGRGVVGDVWVGPFAMNGPEWQRAFVYRALFRAAKLREWGIYAPAVELVQDIDDPSRQTFWLGYGGPWDAAELANMGSFPFQTILGFGERGREIHIRSINTATAVSHGTGPLFNAIPTPETPPQANENQPENQTQPMEIDSNPTPGDEKERQLVEGCGLVQLIRLSLARAILGVSEAGMRYDTLIHTGLLPNRVRVFPTAMYELRTAASYCATTSAIRHEALLDTNERAALTSGTGRAFRAVIRLRARYHLDLRLVPTNPNPTPAPATTAAGASAHGAAPGAASGAPGGGPGAPSSAGSSMGGMSTGESLAFAERMADADCVLFGKPQTARMALLLQLRERLIGDHRLLAVIRPALRGFWRKIMADDKQMPHVRAVIAVIHRTFPHLLEPAIVKFYKLS